MNLCQKKLKMVQNILKRKYNFTPILTKDVK